MPMYTLLHNAEIRTMHPAMPRAEAAVIQGDRFAYVGPVEGARHLLGATPHKSVDCQGCTVIPGLNDSHMHFAGTASRGRNVDLSGARSVAEAIALLRAGLARGGWVVGVGWNQERFAEGRLLTRQDMDAVSTDVPVAAVRACGHIAAVNSRALALAGLDVADGILREDEQDAVLGLCPGPDADEMLDLMLRAQHGLYAKGITSIQSDDMGGMEPAALSRFARSIYDATQAGTLRVRYSEQVLLDTLDRMRPFFAEGLHTLRGAGFRFSCVKLLTDGSLGARTAWLRQPYADAPDTRGIAMYEDAALTALVAEAAAHGMPTAIHAIGDAAMQQTLDAFATAGAGLRHAVVHAQITDWAQVARCGAMGLTIMAQPIFLDADIPVVRRRVGDDLADASYRWRSMLAGGAHVAFGTDCPVETYDPMPNLYCAITRKRLSGGEPYLPGEAFTLDEALYAYTAAGAWASGEEADKGRIQPGMLADYVLLNRRLDDKEPTSLLETGIVETVIGGDTVYSA